MSPNEAVTPSLDIRYSLESAKKYIYAIDFSMIIDKMVKYDYWLREDAEKTCEMYRNFLYLKKKYEFTNTKIPPAKDIDDFWHNHVLDTEKYHQDCEAIFGYYLHHHPTYPGPAGIAKLKLLANAFTELQKIHQAEFGTEIIATRSGRPKFINYILWRCDKNKTS